MPPEPEPRAQTGTPQPDYQSLKAAAEWYATLLSGHASAADRARWQQWLQQAPQHRHAWAEVQAISQQFEPLQHPAQQQAASAALQATQQAGLKRRKVLRGIAVLPATGLAAWLAWRHTPLQRAVMASLADHHTAVGETREILLADGTRLWLNTASVVDVEYTATLRGIALRHGEVLVQTAPDPARALVLRTRHGEMRALGTRFSARLQDAQTHMAVYEGAVRISTREAQTATIQAGGQTRFDAGRIEAPWPIEGREPAWTKGMLIVENMPLAELAAELERYRHGSISVAPEVAHLRVLGSYPLHDTDAALQLLERALPVRVRRILPWWVAIEPQ